MQETECSNAPKLDPRVRRTRKLLEDALRQLFKELPYDAISVADITERATVNRATFYAHFVDKQDLATKMLRGEFHTALIGRLRKKQPLGRESLCEIATAVFEFVGEMKQGCPKMAGDLEARVGPTLQDTLQEFLAHWIEVEPSCLSLFPGSSAETVATVLSWSIYGAATRWNRRTRRGPAAAAARDVVAMLLPGL